MTANRTDSDLEVDVSVSARGKSALLWGAVGLLVFLVLHQAYLLTGGNFLGVGPVALVAVLVFVVTTVGSYYTEGHFEAFEAEVEEEEEIEAEVEEKETDTGEWAWVDEESSDDRE